EKILQLMSRYRGEERRARFRCVIAMARPDGILYLAKGECQGLIADRPRGTGGFGYDPIFYLPPYGKTLAELEPALKNQISHRGMAMKRAKAILREMRGTGDSKGARDRAAP
ncbi:MAG: non-canonical purine NTP pyrophosphatase, partial [candidate division NC10 bacterium]|nr:non-canonical purine NTP pyrophosphatase [candidate division NC10 bacterium]